MRHIVVVLLCAGLAACASAPRRAPSPAVVEAAKPPAVALGRDCSWYRPAEEDPSKRGDYVAGGLYRPSEQDRTPSVIPDIGCLSEPQVVALPRSRYGNNPVYRVLDREYRVLDDTRGFTDEGLASYYGEKFHGRLTSNREVYDMYAFSAAHKTLPLPSFARVTNLDNGRSVVVRVNDRGPFHDGRVMDLSLAAAVKLGVYPAGTGRVRVEALQPGDAATGTTFAAGSAPAPRPSATAIDGLVATLPAQGAAPARTPTELDVATRDYRYAMRDGEGRPNAGGFDAWMEQRGVRVATGAPAVVVASTDDRPPRTQAAAAPRTAVAATPLSTSPAAMPPPASAPTESPAAPRADAFVVAPLPASPSAASAAVAGSSPAAGPAAPSGDAITLQLASFSARDNADRALAALRGAGVAGARLDDAVANGRPIWRLRVGPMPATAEAELAGRLRGLGFNAPQRVHE